MGKFKKDLINKIKTFYKDGKIYKTPPFIIKLNDYNANFLDNITWANFNLEHLITEGFDYVILEKILYYNGKI